MTPSGPESARPRPVGAEPKRFALAAGGIYLALALFVFRGVLSGETFFGGDVYKYFLPAWVEVTGQLKQGMLPVWSPNWSCGVPLLGAMTPSALYPPVVLLAWLPPALGFALCMALHVPFAALGLACFLRQQGVGDTAAIVGGAAFGFGGFTLCLTAICPAGLYVIAWSGWLLLLLERLLRRPSAGRAAALSLAAWMIPLAGEPQYALHLALVLLGWVAVREPVGPRKAGLGWTASAVGITLLLAAVALLPALEVMRYGARSETLGYAYTAVWPVLPRQLVTLASPFVYGSSLTDFPNPTSVLTQEAYPYLFTLYLGALPLLAIAAAPFVARGRLALFCAGCALLFGLAALGEGFGVHRAFYACVPLYDRFRFPYKAWPCAALGLSGLAALGLDGLLRARAREALAARHAVWIAAGLALLLLVLLGVGQGGFQAAGSALAEGQPPALANLVARRLLTACLVLCCAAGLGALALSRRCPRRHGRTLLGAAAVLELAWAAAPAAVTAPAEQLRQVETPSDVVPTRVHFTPFLARYGQIESFDSLPAYVGWASREARVANTGRWVGWEHFRGYDETYAAWHEQLYGTCERMAPEPRVRLLAACGVDVLITSLPPQPGLVPEGELGGGLVRTRVREAFPRAFHVPQAAEVDPDEALESLLAGRVDLGRVALIPDAAAREDPTRLGESALALAPAELPGPRWSAVPPACAIVEHGPSTVRVTAPGEAGVVVLLDVWFPGWTVEVDGEERPLLRTNVAFRGVEVGPDDREVVFRYRPGAVRWGAGITGLGLLLLLSLLAVWLRRSRDSGATPLNPS